VKADSPAPHHLNTRARVFNLRVLREPSIVDLHTAQDERNGVGDFMARYRLPAVDELAEPLPRLKAYLGSPGPFPISRFSSGSFPAVYMGDSEETCLSEISFHLTEKLRETTARVSKHHTFQLSLFILQGETVDVRVGFAKLHLKNDWAPAQDFGSKMWAVHAKGITFRSVRRIGGENTAVFKAPLVELGLKVRAVVLRWDGRKLEQL
jgi:hypothetical protein